MENCDEFIFYEDLVRGQQQPALPQIAGVPEKLQEAFGLLVDSVSALQRENKDVLWGSMIKETMKRKKPSFNETYYGFRTFSHLLEDAQRRGVVNLRRDQKSGSYIIEDLGAAANNGVMVRSETVPSVVAASAGGGESAEANGARAPRRRRSRGRRGGRSGYGGGVGTPTDANAIEDGTDGDEADFGDDADSGEGQADSDNGGSTRADSYSTTEPPRAEHPPRASEPERPAFSFLSWLRRDTTPREAATPVEPPPKREET